MADKQSTAMVYRADLLWGLSTITDDQHGRLAALLGFEQELPVELKPATQTGKQASKADTQSVQSQPDQEITQNKPETASYYRLIDRQIDAEVLANTEQKPPEPDWLSQAKPTYFSETETRIPQIHRVMPHYPPLVSWSRLLPVLQRVLGSDVSGHRPDLPRLVKQVSEGKQIQHIPKTTRYTWSARARVLIDINDSNFPYRQDFLRLKDKLIEERGEEGLEIQYIDDEPGGTIIRDENGQEILQPWCSPDLDTPLLILSDLGMHSKSRRSIYPWLVFGQWLNLQGIRPTVLMPVAERQVDQRLLRYFQCLIWDANSRLKPLQDVAQSEDKDKASQQSARLGNLLALMFPALRVELGLLRGIRQLLPASLYDVGHEVEVWKHAVVKRAGDEWGWQAGSREQFQQTFVDQFKQLSKSGQQQLIDLIGRYHARLPDELYFEAMYQMLVLDILLPDPVEEATLDFLSMLVKTYQKHKDEKGLDLWVKRLQSRHPTLRSEHLNAFMVIEKLRSHQHDQSAIEWPEDISPEQILPFIELQPSAVGLCLLRQKGMQLELISDRHMQDQQNDWGDQGVTLLKIRPLTNRLFLRCMIENNKQQYTINLETDLPFQFSLPSGRHLLEIAEHRFTVEVRSTDDKPDWQNSLGMSSHGMYTETHSRDNNMYRWYWYPPEIDQTLTLPGFWYNESPEQQTDFTPDWAETSGRDQFGLYAEVNIAGIVLIFRWIPPGSFQMGSPEDEVGRYDNETLHQVNFSQGFWLAETTCTQALWQAVMGQNPSDFKGQNRPVESISWNDVQEFLETLNKQYSELNLRLPTESEWEYACRAGTTTALNFADDLNLKTVNYRGAWEYSPDEWGKGALKETAEVKTYPANAWGLYEMHGNVWEWCQDWYGDYPDQSVTDPKGSKSGDRRVLRGGSWIDFGRNCRSACRDNDSPGSADYNIGFRLARGHQSSQVSTVADQQPDGSHASAARGAQPGDGLRDAGTTHDLKQKHTLVDSFKDLFKK